MRTRYLAFVLAGGWTAGAAGSMPAQTDSTAAAVAPAVEHWGDSVTLRNGLSLRLPADNVTWREVPDPSSRYGSYMLVGRVRGANEVRLRYWSNPQTSSCEAFVALQRGTMERLRRAGITPPEERTLENPSWLPRGAGWNSLVWMSNACRDGVSSALILTVDDAFDLRDRRADVLRTLLWYLGEAATRKQL